MVKSLRGLGKKDGITVLNGTSLNIQTHQKIIGNRLLDQFPFATAYVLFHHPHILRMWVENKYVLVLNADERLLSSDKLYSPTSSTKTIWDRWVYWLSLEKSCLAKYPYIYSLWETAPVCCADLSFITKVLLNSVFTNWISPLSIQNWSKWFYNQAYFHIYSFI